MWNNYFDKCLAKIINRFFLIFLNEEAQLVYLDWEVAPVSSNITSSLDEWVIWPLTDTKILNNPWFFLQDIRFLCKEANGVDPVSTR
jgi:hypothetical protein